MLAEKAEAPSATDAAHRSSFFRQSGWLMIANVGGGVMMWGVHFLAKKIPEAEYGVFVALLTVAMYVQSLPLQIVFAQQTAKAVALRKERELSSLIRHAWLGTFGLWLVAVVIVLVFQGAILKRWGIADPAGLWATLLAVLLSLWVPMFSGVVQGQQNFFWLGWVNILNAAGRLSVAAVMVLLLGGHAAGMMRGVCLGLAVASVICIWQTRSVWLVPSQPFNWRGLFAQAVPLMLGYGAFQFLFTADTIFVKSYFSNDETGFYGSAGTLSRALMWLVGPLAAVMFPRIVHSSARAEKTDLMGMVLIGTAILAAAGALGLTILGPWVVKLVYKESYVAVATAVLPWYAWAMVPLALANVLVSNLLARSMFRIVPFLVALAVAYGFALTRFHDSLVMVLQTLGVFNLLLLATCAWFTWGAKATPAAAPQSE